jgi:hypothetical protein
MDKGPNTEMEREAEHVYKVRACLEDYDLVQNNEYMFDNLCLTGDNCDTVHSINRYVESRNFTRVGPELY